MRKFVKDFVFYYLLGVGAFMFISSIIYSFSDPERAFSRAALGVICVGFLEVIIEIRDRKP